MKHKTTSLIRYIFQYGTLLVLLLFLIFGKETDPEAYCPFGGLQALVTFLTKGSLACSMTTVQIMMGAVLALGAILFGKLFCSYLCPLGSLGELLLRLRRKLKMKVFSIKNGSILDLCLRSLKYVLLFLIFFMTISDSELFCKNFDPYYAMATGFQGEITAWMVSITMILLFLGSFFVDMFWCRYICPLGALSTLFKFTLWFLGLILLSLGLEALGLHIPWQIILGAECLMGYLLEILVRRPRLNPQLVAIVKDPEKCNGCNLCSLKCPYHIDFSNTNRITAPECMLCGECVDSCHQKALSVTRKKWGGYIAPAAVVILIGLGLYLGSVTELPTIDEKWNDEQVLPTEKMAELKLEGMRSIKCFGSSMAFKARLENIRGVYGVRTFVKNGKVDILYAPDQTTEEKIREEIFDPSIFRINSPSLDLDSVKMVTVRAEGLHDRMDPNYLGMQIRFSGRKYYGLQTEYDCPIIIRLYMDMNEPTDEAFLKDMITREYLEIPHRDGSVKQIELGFEFVKLEEGEKHIALGEYLRSMFKPYTAEFRNRVKEYADRPQEVLEFTDPNYEKPIMFRIIPYLSSYLSQEEGVIGVYIYLNPENRPSIGIRYCPEIIRSEELRALIGRPVWTVRLKDGSIREESASIKFKTEGTVRKY